MYLCNNEIIDLKALSIDWATEIVKQGKSNIHSHLMIDDGTPYLYDVKDLSQNMINVIVLVKFVFTNEYCSSVL